ncbi:MAG TPA: Bax inhibitor-1/YccA family protein [Gemmatimonadaceae bacterium]|jgi:FtsH-binding integral membrane protein|nr:Bax inhibitor-1/YccA family protein [Gemmatimonadaceae bacterium]
MGVSYQTGTLVRTGEERATLVRRTYALVLVSVLVTMVGASFGLSQPRLMGAVAAHPFITFFVALAPLIMAQRARTQFPMNIGMVLLFNFVMGVMISPALFIYGRTQPGLIGQAAVLTLGAFGILTLYAFVSRRDFSAWGSFLIVGLWVLIGTMLLNLFFRNAAIDLWLASVSVLLFSGLLVFDTWRLRNHYGPDEYVGAAVQIYLDLLNMFMAILRILGNRRN